MHDNEYLFDKENETDAIIRKQMEEKIPIPKEVNNAMNAAFINVKNMSDARNRVDLKRRGRMPRRILAYAAAAAAVFLGVCAVNPAFAARIPLIGHVFETLGDKLGYGGDYTDYAKPLGESGASGSGVEGSYSDDEENGAFSKKDGGMTVTLSETYCNDKALYISVILTSEDKFPDTFIDQNGQPVISLTNCSLECDYNPEPNYLAEELDGMMVDDYTYAGVMRISLDQTLSRYYPAESFPDDDKSDDSVEMMCEKYELPEHFNARLHVSRIYGLLAESTRPEIPEDIRKAYEDAMAETGLGTSDEDYALFTEEEQDIELKLANRMWQEYYERYPDAEGEPNKYDDWWIDGSWDFEFPVDVDSSRTVTARVNTEGKCDIGEITLEMTPFELIAGYDFNKALDYFVVILDADGKPLGYGHGSGSTDDHPIMGHDMSKVTVYVCDYIEYMDEIKGYYFSDDYEEKAKIKTYAKLLDERCVYREEVAF